MRFFEDFRYAVRTLLRNPGFFLLAVLTLGIGMSASVSVFSLFYQVLLRSLPVPEPQKLVVLQADGFRLSGGTSADNSATVYSYPMYRFLRDRSQSFEGLAARSSLSALLRLKAGSEQVQIETVSGNFFEVLRVRAEAGRLLQPADDAPGNAGVAVLSYETWMRRFGGDASIVGQNVSLNGHPFVVVGAAPENFRGVLTGNAPELYIPIAGRRVMSPEEENFDQPGSRWLNIVGRLGPDVSPARAKAELQPLFAAVVRDHMDQLKIKRERIRSEILRVPLEPRPAASGLNELGKQWRKPLLVLGGMVALLLLIGAANLANLLLARGAGRWRETAIRLAVGASGGRVMSLLLAESLVVAMAGAAMGLVMTPVLTKGILSLLPEDAAAGWIGASISVPVSGFAMLLMFIAAVLAGAAPAVQALRTGASSVLGDRSAGSAGHLSPRVRQTLVAAQIALSLVLLSTAGLFTQSFTNLVRRQPGFRTDQLLTFRVNGTTAGYTGDRAQALYREIARRLASIPGAGEVSVAEFSPLSNSEASTNVMVDGYTPAEGENMDADVNAVAPGFLRVLGARLVAGREFAETDAAKSPAVAIVNEAFARRFFQGKSPVGKHMSRGAGGPLDIQIVGEVADMKNLNLKDPPKPTYFIAFSQARVYQATFFVRSRNAGSSLAAEVRSTVAQVDRNLAVASLETMRTKLENNVSTDRLLAALTSSFGLLALVLTAIGLYGVIAYVVTRRTTEIGIRMALGADAQRILQLVLREVVWIVAAGAAVGLTGALAVSRVVRSQLFGMEGGSAWLVALAALVLAAVAMAAGWLPAWRASRIEPLEALRHE
jgi:predicted permease